MIVFFERIVHLGVGDGFSFEQRKKVTMINSMSLILFTIYFFFFFASEREFMVNNAIMTLAQVPPVLLNYLGWKKSATYIFIYSNILILLYLFVMYGYALGAGYAIICWGLLVAYVFDKLSQLWPHIVIGTASFILANVYVYTQGPIYLIQQDFVGVAVIGLCFVTPLLISRIYKNEHESYQKTIKLKNNLLNRQSEEITEQMELLGQRNKEIEKQSKTIKHAFGEIQSSIRYAERIQKALLPMRSLLSENFPEHAVVYKPKDIVSGDFYWLKTINNYRMLAVADCTGHGVPGAFMNAIGNTLLNQIVNSETITRPDFVLDRLNAHLTQVFSQSYAENGIIYDGIDIALCTVCPTGKMLHFSSAKRPMYLIRSGQLEQFKGSKCSVDGSGLGKKQYKLQQIPYQENDIIYLFSDGYSDQFGGQQGKKMKVGNFRNLLLEASCKTMAEQEIYLKTQFDIWKGNGEQIDDVLVVGVRL